MSKATIATYTHGPTLSIQVSFPIWSGKDAADARVERSLYQRAVGYSFDAEKIMQDKGVVVRADYVEHLPPDVSAAQYWLNNRKGYDWKSKVEHEHSGKIGLEQLVAGQGQEPDPETP